MQLLYLIHNYFYDSIKKSHFKTTKLENLQLISTIIDKFTF